MVETDTVPDPDRQALDADPVPISAKMMPIRPDPQHWFEPFHTLKRCYNHHTSFETTEKAVVLVNRNLLIFINETEKRDIV